MTFRKTFSVQSFWQSLRMWSFSIDQDKLNFSECYDATVFIHYDVTDSIIFLYIVASQFSRFFMKVRIFLTLTPYFFTLKKYRPNLAHIMVTISLNAYQHAK